MLLEFFVPGSQFLANVIALRFQLLNQSILVLNLPVPILTKLLHLLRPIHLASILHSLDVLQTNTKVKSVGCRALLIKPAIAGVPDLPSACSHERELFLQLSGELGLSLRLVPSNAATADHISPLALGDAS